MRGLTALVAAVATGCTSPTTQLKSDDVELPVLGWLPRSDWIDVKKHCGARGDGVHDDTAAINRCFSKAPSGVWPEAVAGPTVYFPPGTYRLTDTLIAGTHNMSALPPSSQGWIGGGVVGHGRETQLVWDGKPGGQMLHCHGVAYYRIQGLHLDGSGVAGIGIYHQSDSLFQTEVLHVNLRLSGFTLAAVSISLKLPDYAGGGGKEGSAIASSEVLYRNVIFENSKVGVLLNFFNDYDQTFDGCLWRNNSISIYSRAGISYVRNSRFERSSVCDIVIGDYELFSSAQRVVSVGSRQFVCGPLNPSTLPPLASPFGMGAMRLMDCHVSGWTGPSAVDVDGNLAIVDSTFLAPANTSTGHCGAVVCPSVAVQHRPMGNFTTDGFPVFWCNNEASPGVALRSTAPFPGMPFAPTVTIPPSERCKPTGITAETRFFRSTWSVPGRVFEVGPPTAGGDSSAAIQTCIESASSVADALCYLPARIYSVNLTLVVPQSANHFYIGGAGFHSMIQWTGPDTAAATLRFVPGATATLSDVAFYPRNITTPVPRVLIEGSGGAGSVSADKLTNVTIDGLQMQGTLSSSTVVSWGLVIRDLAPAELVDIVFIDGDIRSVGNRGTIITGFHLNGVVVVEPGVGSDTEQLSSAAPGFFGELMRLSVEGGDTFTTKIVGGATDYVVAAYYEESQHNAFHLAKGIGEQGRVAIEAIKIYTLNSTQSFLDGWSGLFLILGGDISAQGQSIPATVVQRGGGVARIVYATTQPWCDGCVGASLAFDVESAELTLLGNVGTDGKETHRAIPDRPSADENATVVEGLDLFRRLGRLDLQHHYPWLGVRDVCGPAVE
jgi:hypothetical protein